MQKLLLNLAGLLVLGAGFEAYSAAAPEKPAERNMLYVYEELTNRYLETKSLNDLQAIAAEVHADEILHTFQLTVLLRRLSGGRLTSAELRAVDYGTRQKMLQQLLSDEIAAATTRASISASRTTERYNYNDRATEDGSSAGGGAGCGSSTDSCGSYTDFRN